MACVSFLAGTASSLMIIRYHQKLHGGGSDAHADGGGSSSSRALVANGSSGNDFDREHPSLLPFASLGLRYDSGKLAALGALFKKLTPFLAGLAVSVDDSVIIAVICLPISLMCWFRILLSRVMTKV